MRIRVRARRVGRGLRERMEAEFACRLFEQHRAVGRSERRQREFVGTPALERIAAGLDVAAQVAGLAGSAADLFELIEMRFQLVVGHAEVLEVHAFGDELLAVPLFVGAAQTQIGRQRAPVVAVPVHARAADAVAEQERTVLAVWHSQIGWRVTDGDRLLRQILEKLAANAVAQLVGDARVGEVGNGVAVLAALKRQHLKAGGREFHAHDGAGPAEADQHRVDGRFLDGCHVVRFLSPAGRRC